MATPVIVECDADVWTKVATNVTTGFIKKLKGSPVKMLETYRMTGDAAPDDDSEGAALFEDSDTMEIDSPLAGIDVYVYSIGGNGRVRRDV